MVTTIRYVFRALCVVSVAALLTATSSAHEGATGVVKERMDLMESLSASMKRIDAALKASGAPDRTGIAQSARTVGEHAAAIDRLFPAGSDEQMSAASPDVWKNPEDFSRKSLALADAARALAEAAGTGDQTALRAGFRKIGGACSSCHKDFRIKKQR